MSFLKVIVFLLILGFCSAFSISLTKYPPISPSVKSLISTVFPVLSQLKNEFIDEKDPMNAQTNEMSKMKTKLSDMEAINQSLNNWIKYLERLLELEREWAEKTLQASEDHINALNERLNNDLKRLSDKTEAHGVDIRDILKLLEEKARQLNLNI